MYEELIPAMVTATHLACLELTERHREVHADAEVFSLLADFAQAPEVARLLRAGPQIVHELAVAAGPAANRIVAHSNRRLLGDLRAADPDAAAQEMERLLRCLHFMFRLARHSRSASRPAAEAGEQERSWM